MEMKFWNFTIRSVDLTTYIRRFQELAVVYPIIVSTNEKLWLNFILQLPLIQDKTIQMSLNQVDQVV